MAAAWTEAKVRVLIEAVDKASKALEKVRKEIEAYKKPIEETERRMTSWSRAAAIAAGLLLRTMVRGITEAITQMLELGARSIALQKSFDLLAARAQAYAFTLQDLRAATQGMVADYELLIAANRALLLEIPIERFDEFLAAVVRLSRAMGVDTARAIERTTLGLGRLSKRLMDDIGIVVDAQTAYYIYAKQLGKTSDQLTETEKRLAWQTYAIEKTIEAAETLTEAEAGAVTTMERFSAACRNAYIQIGEFLSGMAWMRDILRVVLPVLAYTAIVMGPKWSDALSLAISSIKRVISWIWSLLTTLKAYISVKKIVLALSGPKGWIILAAAIGIATTAYIALTRTLGEVKDAQEALNGAVKDYTRLIELAEVPVAEWGKRIREIEIALEGARRSLRKVITTRDEEIRSMEAEIAYLEELIRTRQANIGIAASYALRLEEIRQRLEEVRAAREREVATIEEEISALETALETLKAYITIEEFHFSQYVKHSYGFRDAIRETALAIHEQLTAIDEITTEVAESIRREIEELATSQEISWARAREAVFESVREIIELSEELREEYLVQQAKVSEFVDDYALRMEQFLEAGKWEEAAKEIMAFAVAMKISYEDAKEILQDYLEMIRKVREEEERELEERVAEWEEFIDDIRRSYVQLEEGFEAAVERYAALYERFIGLKYWRSAAEVVRWFADQFDITLDEARRYLEEFIEEKKRLEEEMIRTSQERLQSLRDLYFELFVQTSEAFETSAREIATSVETYLSAEQFESARDAITEFATLWGISWDKAYSIIAETIRLIREELALLPEELNAELIAAQEALATFQECISQKTWTIETDVSGAMTTLATAITNAIDAGLLGQAQPMIESFVGCSENKIAEMVFKIDSHMASLTSQFETRMKELLALADKYSGEARDIVLLRIAELTTEYQRKMAQLSAWKEQLEKKMVATTELTQEDITKIYEEQSKKFAKPVVRAVRRIVRVHRRLYRPITRQVKKIAGVWKLASEEILEYYRVMRILPERVIAIPPIPHHSPHHSPHPPVNVTVVFNVAGPLDRRQAENVARIIRRELQTVLIEKTTRTAVFEAPTSRIRIPRRYHS